ncbi:MAG: GtrA family protein [Verrucomicrobia bacterium]|nr:GtrA family protein [Verrucomicrobiota bacterium]
MAINNSSIRDVAGKLIRFCVVGGSGVFVDMAVLFLLADPTTLAWPILVGKALAAEIAMVNNFVWNEVWTFRDRSGLARSMRDRLMRLLRFNLICSGGIVIAVVTLKTLVSTLAFNLYLANLAAIATATAWNFGMNYAFNWRKGER